MSEEQYPSNPELFLDFEISNELLEEFRLELENVEIKITKEEFNENRKDIALALKREIAGRFWGESGKQMISVFNDNEIKMSLNYINKAKEIL